MGLISFFFFLCFFFSWGCMSLSREDSRKICTLVYTIRFHSAPNTRPLVFSRAHLLFFFAFSLDCPRTRTVLLFSLSLATHTHTHNTHAYIQTVFLSLSLSYARFHASLTLPIFPLFNSFTLSRLSYHSLRSFFQHI